MHQELARDPAEQGAPKHDQGRQTAHQLDHQAAAEDHDRDRKPEPAGDQQAARTAGAGVGDGRDGDDVVQSGRQVGEEDGADRRQQRVAFTDLGFTVLFTAQGDANPEQEQRAEQTQAPDLEQFGGEQGERDAQAHGDDDPPQDRLAPRSGRQAARGHGNDDGVVAGKQQVQPGDFEQAEPEGGGEKFGHAGLEEAVRAEDAARLSTLGEVAPDGKLAGPLHCCRNATLGSVRAPPPEPETAAARAKRYDGRPYRVRACARWRARRLSRQRRLGREGIPCPTARPLL